ncbi:hypothetical protein RchiOBHm_Chr1g0332131 [Rosa chinensis]|uniref:Transmembrane protein n=1 Tax=Rosa chinensis TaxID=74649 RepID=A0A2P6SBR2_ROSCH|nr:hypothetical protein RchiOBHm_Chr1g0332131 [Rosa chinensis]
MAGSTPKNTIRCHHCAGPLSKEMETSAWTVPPLIRDSFSMIGSAVGGTVSAFYGFNYGNLFYICFSCFLYVACAWLCFLI